MKKITWRLASAAATLAVTGGILFSTGGAAAAATGQVEGVSVAATSVTARHGGYLQRWDGLRWWYRYSGHGDWYSAGHGERYRFDGHRFYRWDDGKWKPVSAAYARHHSLDRDDLNGRPRTHHVKHNDHGHAGHAHHGGKGHDNDDHSGRDHH
ncbi:hypothetical protein [Nonomuraea jiangxiensis]|uniref:YXWGXW repeat-containing protein n=1 Tax=Nonomuraea jiangxiensis TaxID=633440 RepID=A0A1G8TWL5_9ACTN|nr:hypothetical protein [Nonomuraea jiangxiensis]SDJ45966.1 hypothetical protein SAMN05421869_110312 [Nonomuraea jiangxiensis]